MKKIRLLVAIIILGFGLTSCSSDGYSLDDFVVSLATVDSISPSAFSLKIDNGERLWPVNNTSLSYGSGQRVIVDFTILSDKMDGYDHYVRINSLFKVLTKDVIILTAENSDSLANDPIRILNIWSGGDFLNIEFAYNHGNKVHMLNLVKNTTEQLPEDGKIYLEFRHNAFNDRELSGVKGMVCFNIFPFRKSGTNSVEFVILNNDFGQKRTFNVIYKYE